MERVLRYVWGEEGVQVFEDLEGEEEVVFLTYEEVEYLAHEKAKRERARVSGLAARLDRLSAK